MTRLDWRELQLHYMANNKKGSERKRQTRRIERRSRRQKRIFTNYTLARSLALPIPPSERPTVTNRLRPATTTTTITVHFSRQRTERRDEKTVRQFAFGSNPRGGGDAAVKKFPAAIEAATDMRKSRCDYKEDEESNHNRLGPNGRGVRYPSPYPYQLRDKEGSNRSIPQVYLPSCVVSESAQ